MNGMFVSVLKDIRAASCHFKGTPKKFIGSMRGKSGGEITKYHSGRFTVRNDKQMGLENGSERRPLGDWKGRGKAKDMN